MLLLDRETAGLKTSQSELAVELGLDKSSITRLCARLEADDRVTQQRGEDDARSRQLKLTARGRKLATNVQSASLRRFQRIAEALPNGKRRGVLESIELLTAAVASLAHEEET